MCVIIVAYPYYNATFVICNNYLHALCKFHEYEHGGFFDMKKETIVTQDIIFRERLKSLRNGRSLKEVA